MTTPPPPVSRSLMAAVIGMGILIVIGTASLIGVVIHRAMGPGPVRNTASVSSPVPAVNASIAAGASRALSLGEAGHVLSQTVRPDGSVSILVATAEGEEIVIWSPEANRVMARLIIATPHP